MAAKEIAVKKYIVKLSEDEQKKLGELIQKGKRSAQLLTKARILLKADVSDAGDGWSDSRIAEALDTNVANIERTRRQLVEEGFDAVLTRKYNPNCARSRIFDGAAEAKLIALTCGPAPSAMDYAQVLKELSDTHFPGAAKIVLVQDNLSTHKPASLYEAFPAAEACRLTERFEWHYTPKHGSWLDMAESELRVLAAQCLDRRIPDKLNLLIEEVAAWEEHRNKHHAKADWQFTTADARVKLKRLYP